MILSMRRVGLIALLSTAACASSQDAAPPATDKPAEEPATHPRVKIETTLGDMVIELDEKIAPHTVRNFLTYCTEGYYDGTIFYKVQSTELPKLVSGGGVTPSLERKKAGLHPPIACEWNPDMKNRRGTVGMVRPVGREKATQAEFYINTADNPSLDKVQRDGKGFCVFGRVVEGMDVLDKIKSVKVHRHEKYRAGGEVVPVEPIIIKKARRVGATSGEEKRAESPSPKPTGTPADDAPE